MEPAIRAAVEREAERGINKYLWADACRFLTDDIPSRAERAGDERDLAWIGRYADALGRDTVHDIWSGVRSEIDAELAAIAHTLGVGDGTVAAWLSGVVDAPNPDPADAEGFFKPLTGGSKARDEVQRVLCSTLQSIADTSARPAPAAPCTPHPLREVLPDWFVRMADAYFGHTADAPRLAKPSHCRSLDDDWVHTPEPSALAHAVHTAFCVSAADGWKLVPTNVDIREVYAEASASASGACVRQDQDTALALARTVHPDYWTLTVTPYPQSGCYPPDSYLVADAELRELCRCMDAARPASCDR